MMKRSRWRVKTLCWFSAEHIDEVAKVILVVFCPKLAFSFRTIVWKLNASKTPYLKHPLHHNTIQFRSQKHTNPAQYCTHFRMREHSGKISYRSHVHGSSPCKCSCLFSHEDNFHFSLPPLCVFLCACGVIAVNLKFLRAVLCFALHFPFPLPYMSLCVYVGFAVLCRSANNERSIQPCAAQTQQMPYQAPRKCITAVTAWRRYVCIRICVDTYTRIHSHSRLWLACWAASVVHGDASIRADCCCCISAGSGGGIVNLFRRKSCGRMRAFYNKKKK